MTVTTEVARATFPWTGVETSFSCGFPADQVSHLRVLFRTVLGTSTLMTLGVNYDATLSMGAKLATVTPISFPAATGTVIVTRVTPAQVVEVLADGQEYSLAVIQALHDRAAMRSAEDRLALSRAIVLAEGSDLGVGNFDLAGSGIDNLAPGTTSNSAATVGQLLDLIIASGNVPSPLLADVGRALVAVGAGLFGWGEIGTAGLADGLLSADAAGRAKMADRFIVNAKLGDMPANTIKFRHASDGVPGDGAIGRGLSVDASGISVDHGYFRGFIAGLTLANNTAFPNTTLDIAAGVAMSDDSTRLMKTGALSKTTAAWAVGAGNGALDTGVIANSTWYHVFLIERLDTSVVDVIFSASPTAPTMPVGYTAKRILGSFKTNGSGQIIAFSQNGDEFLWAVPTLDHNNAGLSTSATLLTLNVPTGRKVNALAHGLFQNATVVYSALLSSLDTTDTAPGVNGIGYTGYSAAASPFSLDIRTDTSARIRARCTSASTSILITTQGWRDPRGRFA